MLAHGLVRGSFVLKTPIQEVRDLTRTRKQLARELIQHQNRIEKIVEDANVEIASAMPATSASIPPPCFRGASRSAASAAKFQPSIDHKRVRGPRPSVRKPLGVGAALEVGPLSPM